MSSPSKRLLNKKFRKGLEIIATKLKINKFKGLYLEDYQKLQGVKNPYVITKNLEQYIKSLNRGRVILLKEGLRHIVKRNKDKVTTTKEALEKAQAKVN